MLFVAAQARTIGLPLMLLILVGAFALDWAVKGHPYVEEYEDEKLWEDAAYELRRQSIEAHPSNGRGR
jgi:hypothetical protein